MNSERYRFCLLERGWIGCIDEAGAQSQLGIREVLVRAHELAGLSDPSPLVESGLLRLLLCILHRVVDGPRSPEEWRTVWDRGRFDEERIDAYLNGLQDRFDLFHPEHPFFQVGGFEIVDPKSGEPRTKPVSQLSMDLACGNNATLFDHSLDTDPEERPADWCARHLVATQAWALGGGISSSSSLGKHPNFRRAPGVGGIHVFLGGQTVFETLTRNLLLSHEELPLPRRRSAEDRPVWERDGAFPPGERLPQGYLEYLSLPARYLRLLPEGPSERPVVRELYFASGLSLPKDPEVRDPFQFFRPSKKEGYYPVSLEPDRAIWRDSSSLFVQQGRGSDRAIPPGPLIQAQQDPKVFDIDAQNYLPVLCFGLANDKAKPLAWRREELPYPARLFEDPDLPLDLDQALQQAEGGASVLWNAISLFLERLHGTATKRADPAVVKRERKRLLQNAEYWSRLERAFHPFLEDLSRDPSPAVEGWERNVQIASRKSFHRGMCMAPGSGARRLRAEAEAEKSLEAGLFRLRQETEEAA